MEQQISSTGDILNQEKEMLTLLAEEGYLPQNETTDQLLQQLGITAEEIAAIKNTIAAIKDQLPNVGETIDPIAIQELLKKLQESFQTLDQQLQALKTTLQKTTAIITAMKTQAPTLNKALLYLEDGFQDLEWGMDYLTKGTEEITKAIRVMRQGEPLAIPEIDDEFRGNLDDFHAAIDNLENQFSHLNTTLSDTQDQLVQDMNTINGQFLQIINILSDTYDRNQPGQEEDFIEDVSDENTSGNSLGKITACLNYGKIQADINTGGIVGAMAIEYDFDPEDDVVKQGSSSLRFTYKTKAIIEKCQNQGIITGKKNYIGSIVGKMDLGTVIFCEGYGNTQSTDGSFVGGIAGFSNGFIRSSVAKCTLAGEDFVGGITGQGKTIKNCYTLVNITQAEENKGAIAGIDGEEPQEISQNYFVGDTIGGIDNISYQNRAEATTIEEFSNFVQTTFGHPVAFTLTYLADEEVIATLPFTYKTPIDTSLIPSVPEKPGYYGVWSEYDYELPQFDSFITAEYYHAIEILPSALKREGKAVLLICGDFDDHAQMMIRENAEEDKILGKKIINSYLVEITETTPKSQYTVRYLPQKENCQIIIAYGSGSEPQTLEEITAKPFGRYLEFSVPSSTFTLYEVPADSFLWLYAAIAITLCLFGYLFYKKKKTKINSLQKQEELQEN